MAIYTKYFNYSTFIKTVHLVAKFAKQTFFDEQNKHAFGAW